MAGEGDVQLTAAEVKALSDEQKVCAVTGEPLGSMGEPVPVSVTDSKGERHTVLLYCSPAAKSCLRAGTDTSRSLGKNDGGSPRPGD